MSTFASCNAARSPLLDFGIISNSQRKVVAFFFLVCVLERLAVMFMVVGQWKIC